MVFAECFGRTRCRSPPINVFRSEVLLTPMKGLESITFFVLLFYFFNLLCVLKEQ